MTGPNAAYCLAHHRLERPRTTASKGAPPLAGAPVRGVVLDAASLLDGDANWRRRLIRLINQLGIPAQRDTFFRDWDHLYLREVHAGHREYGEAFESFLLAAGLSWAQVDEVEAASRREREDLEQNPRALPGAAKTVAGLAQRGFELLAWADSPFPAQQTVRSLQQLGLADSFSAVISSFDIGFALPSLRCFEAVIERALLPAEMLVYAGPDPATLQAAQAAGLRAVAFNAPQGVAADACVGQFEDLCQLLEQTGSAPTATAPSRPLCASQPRSQA